MAGVGRTELARPPTASSGPARALVVTGDEQLLDDLLRLAAAAAADVDVMPGVAAARAAWGSAPLVVLGNDQAAAAELARLPRRDDVVLIGRHPDDAEVWAVAVRVGASRVAFLPADESWLVERLADCAEQDGPDAPVVCTIGGRGGAGASTLAAGLASVADGAGWRPMLVDGDPWGGGIELLLGSEGVPGTRWAQLAAARGRVSSAALTEGLPRVGELAVLSWDRGASVAVDPAAMVSVLRACRRSFDLVVVDLPRALDAAAREALTTATLTLVVVPAEVRATAAAARVCAELGAMTADVRLVVRGPAPSGLTATAVGEALGLPVVGFLRPEPQLVRDAERGDPPGRRRRSPMTRLCTVVLDDLARRRAA